MKWNRLGFTALNLVAVGVLLVIDWLTPAGVVVGILLCLPIMLVANTDDPRAVWITFGFAAVGFVTAAALGRGPVSPASVWVPNRILAFLTLPATFGIALFIQSRRRQLERARSEAARTSDLNRLLMSLLAHDLRSPLGMAAQTFEYVNAVIADGGRPDPGLLAAVDTRIRRSLGTVDGILSLARGDVGSPASRRSLEQPRTGRDLAAELETELRAFEPEAVANGKVLSLDLAGDDARWAADLLVLRQAAAILVDNAIRHARPGAVWVTGTVAGGEARLTVEDNGPALQPTGSAYTSSGLGLELCRALVLRAGGNLQMDQSAKRGTRFTLRLPLAVAA